ncbi:hypothetical protein FH972_021063 [Carpinus fangiana]|uniref:Uncharacterized protein n=1 Tax=Carpinus fangiana TaxID=176857 RepID=A0A5N6KNG1_9ROSI|nr:hypothetical protein FH972_021063 [Carpinus fangiana]
MEKGEHVASAMNDSASAPGAYSASLAESPIMQGNVGRRNAGPKFERGKGYIALQYSPPVWKNAAGAPFVRSSPGTPATSRLS